MRSSRLVRVAAVIALAVTAAFGLSQVSFQTSLSSFLPSGDDSVATAEELARSFGGDPVVVLFESEEDDVLLDQQHVMPLLRLEGQLAGIADVAAVYGPATVLNQVAGRVQDFLAELSGRRDALLSQAIADAERAGASEAAAKQAGERAIAEFDRRYGALIVQGMPTGLPTLRNAGFVDSVVFTAGGDPRPQWRFVVPSQRAVAVLVRPREGLDQAATGQLVRAVEATVAEADIDAARITVTGVPALASALGDQVNREIPLLGGLAVGAVALVFFLVPWTRRSRRLLPLASTLLAIALTLGVLGLIGMALSIGAVAFLSVLLGVGCYYPMYFAIGARRRVVLTVAVATAAGFATLLLSPLPFVRDLGLTLSVGVLISALLGWVLFGRGRKNGTDSADAVAPATVPAASSAPLRRRIAVLLVVGGIAAFGWGNLAGLSLRSDPESFARGLPALADAQHAEAVMGSSGELDVLLRGPDVTSPEALSWMRRAQQVIVTGHADEARPVISPPSLLSFLGAKPTDDQVSAALRLLPPYLTAAVIRGDAEQAILVFGVRMADLAALRALRDDITRELPPPPEGFSVELGGLPMAAVRTDELVSGDRVLSNVAGIVAASGVLLLGLRRRTTAARALLAAVLATGTGLAVLALAGIPLSPITAALGSLTAAVGCEFTVLLSEAARRRDVALRRSVLLAVAASAIGYAALTASQLAVIREFGLLLAGSVLLALAAALCAVWVIPHRGGELEGQKPSTSDGCAADSPSHPSPLQGATS